MRKTTFIIGLVAASLIAESAFAGRYGSSSSSSRSSSSSYSSKSTSSASSRASVTTRASTSQKAASMAQRPSVKAAASRAAQSSANSSSSYRGSTRATSSGQGTSPRQTLTNSSGHQPSPQLTQIIREKESGGIGLHHVMYGALLYSLLSSADELSASDKSWIESEIEDVKTQQQNIPVNDGTPFENPISFTFDGPDTLEIGKLHRIVVTASDQYGGRMPVECSLPPAQVNNEVDHSTVYWAPTEPGSQILVCRSVGETDQRLLRVGSKAVEQGKTDSGPVRNDEASASATGS